jgi:PAS domain S-box-containing protein
MMASNPNVVGSNPHRPQPEEWMRDLFEAIDDAVFVHDFEGRIFEANPAACKRLGYTREELLGLTTRDIDAPEFASGFRDRLREQCSQGPFRCEGVHITKDGRRIAVDINTSPIQFGSQPGVLAVIRDVTQRKNDERHQRMQYAVAHALAKNDTLESAADEVLRSLCDGLGLDVGVLWIEDDSSHELLCEEIWRLPGLDVREFMRLTRSTTFRMGEGTVGQVWRTGQPAWEPLDRPHEVGDRLGLASRAGLRAVCTFPIQHSSATIGVLEFFSRQPTCADDEMQPLVAALGSQIGQVLQRERVEKSLRDSEALFESLVVSLPQNIFRKDRDGRFVYANQRFCETIKKPLEEILGRTDFDLFPADLASKYVQDDRHLLADGEPLETVEEHRTPDGKRLYVQVVKTAVRDSLGIIVGVQGIFWDVTEKTIALEMLAHSEHRYRQLAEASLDGIVLADERGIVQMFNPAAERIFGYAAEEVLGRPATMLVPEELRAQHERERVAFLQSRVPSGLFGRTTELHMLRKDGSELPCEMALSVLSVTDDPIGPIQFLATIRDLSELNKGRAAALRK